MPNSVQHTHYSQILTNVSVEFKQAELVAEQIFPRKKVEHETDVYYKFDKSSFNIVDDVRADGAPENESTGGWIEVPYATNQYGLRDKITKRAKENADNELELEIAVTNRITQQLRNQVEYRALGHTGILRTTANNGGYSAGSLMTGTNASPRTVITTAINAVQSACGVAPNVMVMNPQILREITLTAEYRDEFKHVTDIRNSDVPQQLYGLKVIEAPALGNLTSGFAPQLKGLAPSLNYIMDNDIWVGYVKPGNLGMRDFTYGVTFFTEQYSRKWYDEETEVDWIACDDNYCLQIVSKEAGYLVPTPFG